MASLTQLAQKARQEGGFWVYATPAEGEGDGTRGYQVLTRKGLRENPDVSMYLVESTCKVDRFDYILDETSTSHRERGKAINEFVVVRDLSVSRIAGYKKVKEGWFKSRQEPVYGWPRARTRDLLERGTDEKASELLYIALSVEPDQVGRPDANIGQGLVASESLIEQIVAESRKEPGKALEIFRGVFPELDRNHHPLQSGRIAIGRYEDAKEAEKLERLAIDYSK
jgi:hypothetical protein